jgi:hypothetical protein
VVDFLEVDRSLKRAHALPSRIECGFLRSAIRSCYGDLTVVEELSVKTAMKNEKRYCKHCQEVRLSEFVDNWKKERFEVPYVDSDHVTLFAEQLGRNIPGAWNLRGEWPYVPNGHSTKEHSRADGGNWNEEDMADEPAIQAIISSGKPRIVTPYSGRNTEVLYPLNRALFSCLKRKGWLLTGEPTPEKVASLNGCGEMISVDYRNATDNIKTAYVTAAVEVLITKAEALSEEQVWALRNVARLSIDGKLCTRGQPMGSIMSFPLLCLVNKTCVDLALNDLLSEGEISFKEWTSHRCLINGDDLLLKSPTHQGALTFLPRLCWHGGQVGLEVNTEKTMVSSTGLAEMNSTLFIDGVLEKKTNAGIFRGGEVSDVLGYADRSTISTRGFVAAVKSLLTKLRFQQRKAPQTALSVSKWRALLRAARGDPDLYDALTTVVREEPLGNAFPVVDCPPGYELSAEEEKACIEQEVRKLRRKGYKGEAACGYKSSYFLTKYGIRIGTIARLSIVGRTSLRKSLCRKKPVEKPKTLKVLALYWENKTKEKLVREDDASVDLPGWEHVCDICATDSRIGRMSCELKAFKQKRKAMMIEEGSAPDPEIGTRNWIRLEP